MAFVAAAAPYLAAAGAAYQGLQSSQAQATNAKIMGFQAKSSIDQANVQELMVRRNSRQALGAQLAAFGASGAGYGGSSEGSLDQSAINQEIDALNTRYKGAITGYGYNVQSGLDNTAATQSAVGGALMAGSKLLQANSPNYTLSQPAGGTPSGTNLG